MRVKLHRRSLMVLILVLLALAYAFWRRSSAVPEPKILSFTIGQTFEEVAKSSTYSVFEHSNIPTKAYLQAGETFVTEPAVVLQFNDPKHGFRLPPTKFAMIGYTHNRVETVATSPMMEKLSFAQAAVVLEELQNQFKTSGWEPCVEDGSVWFDLTANGKKRLYARLLTPGFSHEATLRVPNKYSMVFRIWCAEGCMARRPPYKFLIDIGIGHDFYAGSPASTEPLKPRTY